MTNGDYYEVLGVSRKATPRDIRRAYRALARKYHPDLHPDDKAASQKFREIQEAYEVLKDSRKRKAYEYYGPRFGHRIPAEVLTPLSNKVRPTAMSHSVSGVTLPATHEQMLPFQGLVDFPVPPHTVCG
jgi:curved DNA-binding protein CbpA